MVETLFCWAVELPPASGACLLTSRWLWKLKEQLSWKKPWATRAVLSKYFLHIPTRFLRQFNCKVSNFIQKPSFHLNPSEMIHWTISLLYVSLKPLQSEHISIYFNTFHICQYISICSNILHYLSIYFFEATKSEHISPKLLPILASPVNIACSSTNAPKKYYH